METIVLHVWENKIVSSQLVHLFIILFLVRPIRISNGCWFFSHPYLFVCALFSVHLDFGVVHENEYKPNNEEKLHER